ncbi:MAG TPA: hypothetical protein VEC96_12020 [Anaerolineae bacterium]|nr:hypothetical protein [Anaerolineae bacterium]
MPANVGETTFHVRYAETGQVGIVHQSPPRLKPDSNQNLIQ